MNPFSRRADTRKALVQSGAINQTRQPRSWPAIVVKLNRSAEVGICGLCGQRTEPRSPYELYIEGSQEIVCPRCGERFAPALSKLLDMHYEVESTLAANELEEIEEKDTKQGAK